VINFAVDFIGKYLGFHLKTYMSEQFTLILWGFGILFTGIFGLIGFIIYDRHHARTVIREEVAEMTHPQAQQFEKEFNQIKQDIVLIKNQLKLA